MQEVGPFALVGFRRLFGVLFLRERLTWQLALGMVLIVGAVWLVNGNRKPAFLKTVSRSRQP